ncbi:sensor histidine kinase [Nesterenkonia lutea]|uniref:Two-component system LytT family sensor kinase n=1 Tax=Nesterenkonia lutea TaxID=272919 RepID=A0ABR9JF71_9MICC|nr:histidine kinase [Nesterenkonia lutea]MBE1524445.1 two-component system LytT family sensor kinase [Nesterenkonia lutea]
MNLLAALAPLVLALALVAGVIIAAVLLYRTHRDDRADDDAGRSRTGESVISPEIRAELSQASVDEAMRRQLVEAELRSLRAQISPHFIYNSLNAIAATIPADPVRARELVLDFADFTRYSLRAEGEFTTLREELAAVERYVLLEKARFGDRIEVRLQIAPEVLGVQIPFLAVQPLVENAVRHGVDSAAGSGTVWLRAADTATHAEISVEDDGQGAEPEAMRQVLHGQAGNAHIGVRNVDLRLRQAYGADAGLMVETAPGAGMKVSMRIPKFQPGPAPLAESFLESPTHPPAQSGSTQGGS